MTQRNDYVVKAHAVRKGDIMWRQMRECVVETIKTGPKWTEIRDADEKLISRTPKEADVGVSRIEPTEEEREAQRRAYRNDMIAKFAEGSEDDWEAAQVKFAKEIKGGYDAERYSFVYSALMHAHATHALKVELVQLYNGIRKNTNPDADWVFVWSYFREDQIDKLIDNRGFQGQSRSSSQVSNLLEDIQQSVIAHAVRGIEYPR